MMEMLLPGCLLAAVIAIYLVNRHRKISKKTKSLRDNWGKIPEKKVAIESANLYFKLNKDASTSKCYRVDDSTWDDLDFNELFEQINRTATLVGAQYLYNMLRYPVFDTTELDRRERLIQHFSENQSLREKIQLALQRLDEKNAQYLPLSLWKPLPDKPAYAKALPFLSALAVVFLALVIVKYLPFDFILGIFALHIVKYMHVGFIFGIFALHIVIQYYVKLKIEPYISSLQYLGVLIHTAGSIASLEFRELKDIQATLNENLKHTKNISGKLYTLQHKDQFGIMGYVNIYFLWDIVGFYSVIDTIKHYLKELRAIYETIGYVDALISIASFRLQYRQFCRPVFGGNNGKYSVKNIYNPLVNKPVPNTFDFESKKNVIITGSNMAGKTTFLKTMGVNAILAQTINTCMAEHYEAPFIKVMSTIGMKDNLILGKSYYLVEVESILRLLNASKSDTYFVHLFIMDEIFRGTNSVERFAASIEVLKYLANNKDYILVATHDVQLSETLGHDYSNYHFQEEVCDTGLAFDYKIQPGSAKTRNAIALLAYAGYPESIIVNAHKRISEKES